MTSGNVQVSQDGPVAFLTLTRPKKLNAVDAAALTEFHRALADADADPAIRVVVLTGSGERAFCAGAVIHLGHHRAAELTMLGEAIPAAEAARLGLVNRVVPAADLMPEAKRLAHALAEKPATALRLLKQALRIGPGMDVGAGLAYERDLNMLCFTLPERLAAMQRFLGGRPETTGGQS